MVLFSLEMVPLPQWDVRSFEAPDPWDANAPARWQVVACKMVSRTFVEAAARHPRAAPADRSAVPAGLAVGISTRHGRRYRILPMGLRDLWQKGEVRDEDLPRLLHQAEDSLRASDYPPELLGFVSRVLAVFALVVTVFAIAALLFAPAPDRIIAFTSTADWLALARQTAQPVRMRDPLVPITLVDVEPVGLSASATARPAFVLPQAANARTQLALVQAVGAKRMALVARAADLNDPAGVVLPTAATTLPASTVAALKARYPDLDTQFVLGVGWQRSDALSPYEASGFAFARDVVAVFGVVACLCLLIDVARQLRRRLIRRRFRTLAGGAAGNAKRVALA